MRISKAALVFLFLFLATCIKTIVANPFGKDENLSVTIGTTAQFQHPEAFRMPYDFHWQSSLSQSLYYPEEIGLTNGILSGISYYINFSENLTNKPIQIWVGETTLPNLYNGWIDPQSLTLVFNGLVSFPAGNNTVNIEFDTPYQYNGGTLVIYSHRVWETNYHGWGNRFYTTRTEGISRTRQVNEDNNTLNPLNPTLNGNWRVDWFPTVTLHFPLEYFATIEGNVTYDGQPLEGVSVTLPGTSFSAISDNNGHYELTNVMGGIYDIVFSKQGFHPHTEEQVLLQGGETTTVNVSMTPVEKFNVFGVVKGNDGLGLENANVLLEGLTTYQVVTGTNGNFIIEDVFEGNYSLTFSSDGFESHIIQNVSISGADLDLGVITLIEIIISPLGLTAKENPNNPGEVNLEWYHDTTSEFRHDAGFEFWIGVQGGNHNMVFGTVFRHYAVLSELAWYLSSEMQNHPTVNLWLFGLDEDGQPSRGLPLWSAAGVSNIDDQWNVINLGAGVVAENGFLFGISAPGGAFLGVDNGASEQWPFRQNTHFFTANINANPFEAIETISNLNFNFNLRALGIDNGIIYFDGDQLPKKISNETNFLLAEKPSKSADNNNPFGQFIAKNVGSKIFSGFNVFLNDMETPVGFTTNKSFVLSNLEAGNYTAGVQASYSSSVSEIIVKDFIVSGNTQVVDQALSKINVFPNPVNDQINVCLPNNGFFNLEVFDASGKLVQSRRNVTGLVVFSAKNWLPGFYFLKIGNEKGSVSSHKIIKQ